MATVTARTVADLEAADPDRTAALAAGPRTETALELLRELQRHEEALADYRRAADLAPEMRVMFITGFAAVTLKAGKQVPQARVLSKPFHLRDLVMEVDRLFEPGAVPSSN